jgi:hypothetical protein
LEGGSFLATEGESESEQGKVVFFSTCFFEFISFGFSDLVSVKAELFDEGYAVVLSNSHW